MASENDQIALQEHERGPKLESDDPNAQPEHIGEPPTAPISEPSMEDEPSDTAVDRSPDGS